MNGSLSPEPKTGPLVGLTVIEMAGLGPVPLASLILPEMGADVVRIERQSSDRPFLQLPDDCNLDRHGRSILKLDLKQPQGVELVLRLAEKADALVEGFRPGAMERIGLGPDTVLKRNPALIYGRMTGFGQDGPLAGRAGHDITYLALSGILHAIGPGEGKPIPPLNLVGDYAGGTMMLIAGLLAALFQRTRTGKGQVIDASMVEGASMLAAPIHAFMAAGQWNDKRGQNLLDSGAPFYDTYETADGRHMAVGCLEPQFFAEFARLLPLDAHFIGAQYEKNLWPRMREEIATMFRQKTRDQWAEVFAGTDACVTPVLSFAEARQHPHAVARQAYVNVGQFERPAPSPRFSASPTAVAAPPDKTTLDPSAILARFGISESDAEALVKSGIVGQ